MKLRIRLYPEIIIKSKQVRKNLIKRLRLNIKHALKKIDSRIEVFGQFDRIEINLNFDDAQKIEAALSKLQKVPGIDSIQIIEEITFHSLDDLFDSIFPLIQAEIEGKSFAVRPKRKEQAKLRSLEVAQFFGQKVLERIPSSSVNLDQPDYTLAFEFTSDLCILVKQQFSGIGGFPIGSHQRVLSLISGGYDSTVSSYLMMKKGLEVDFLFFNLGGMEHEIGVKEVSHFLAQEFSDGYQATFTSINFEAVVEALLKTIHHKYRGVVLKRLFIRAANLLCEEGAYHAIVTGESLGQVSSQTLINLNVITQAAETLILRPLLALGKNEIIDISREIGTESFASRMPEFCAVISDKPSTAAKLEAILDEEKNFDFNLLNEAVKNKDRLKVDQFTNLDRINEAVKISHFPKKNDVIIDLRDEEKRKKKALSYSTNTVLDIPFFKLSRQFKDLDQSKNYLFYCEKGVISNLVVSDLLRQGAKNVSVLRILEKSVIDSPNT